MKYKRPSKLPAPEYVDALMNWAQGILDDERIFPMQIGAFLPLLSPSSFSSLGLVRINETCALVAVPQPFLLGRALLTLGY